jgi:uroporphyrinogen decarboxylase
VTTEFIKAFSSTNIHVPFWYMRQAGRYLPEYRSLREASSGFLDMCYSPEKAKEVTLQPLRRFDMSAAIIFSDILVIPHALGLKLEFEAGEGPKLQTVTSEETIPCMDEKAFIQFLHPVYTALKQTREALSQDKTLIGFSGAPWTLACYMLQGRGGKEFAVAREMVHRNKPLVKALINVLTQAVAVHMVEQIKSGANAVQLFDSWAGLIPEGEDEWLIIEPARKIRDHVKAIFPDVPMIGFPKGYGMFIDRYSRETGMDGIGVDMHTPMEYACARISEDILIQGNLDPLLLASSKDGAMQKANEILASTKGRKFIFNLGHGMVPHTPVEHVEALSALLHKSVR